SGGGSEPLPSKDGGGLGENTPMFRDIPEDISTYISQPTTTDIQPNQQNTRMDIVPGDKVLSSHPLSMGQVFEVLKYPYPGNQYEGGDDYKFVITSDNRVIGIQFLEKISPPSEPLSAKFKAGDKVVVLFHEKMPHLIGTTQTVLALGNVSVKFESGEYAVSYDDICHVEDNPMVRGCPDIRVGGIYYATSLKSQIKPKRFISTREEWICSMPGDSFQEVTVLSKDIFATETSPKSKFKEHDTVEVIGKPRKGKRGVIDKIDHLVWVRFPGQTISFSYYSHQLKSI
ncbi:hypothetical protein, partial [Nodularia sphaerocarpa]